MASDGTIISPHVVFVEWRTEDGPAEPAHCRVFRGEDRVEKSVYFLPPHAGVEFSIDAEITDSAIVVDDSHGATSIRHIADMDDISPESVPIDDVYLDKIPDSHLVAARLKFKVGRLSVCDLNEKVFWKFKPSARPRLRQNVAQKFCLDLKIEEGPTAVLLAFFGKEPHARIELTPAAGDRLEIILGNAMPEDLVVPTDHLHDPDVERHFELYYMLSSAAVPHDPPVPRRVRSRTDPKFRVGGSACPPLLISE
ncbi:MAG TPA: hypothetical protein VFI57_08340 [Pyrinomonadaceae bacterium]|nr:hypothetical protein [Pyrinomonadaceae bacterium]